uniref:RNA-directed RNA polymerase n=1 Tax=Riboviria sp. TaxID=2585031 RepID=A0A514D1A5_9VIRU|nr:MAG: RNA-dependent RNA polymerase [Riboviria sp.]
MYWCHVPAVDGVWAPVVHSPCVHNEYSGLAWRTLGPTPEFPNSEHLRAEFRRLRGLVRRLAVERTTMKRVVEGYSGPMRDKYQKALESFSSEEWLVKRDRRLSAFVKGEKVNPLKRSPTKPRVIMARSPRFNLRLATYLKPLEAALWKNWRSPASVGRTRMVAKGLNLLQRARLIRRKMGLVGSGCVVFEVDGKQFEAHVTRDDLGLEHSVYRAAYPRDPELADLLQSQLQLRGRTMGGIRYGRDGCRASGDYNTGLGNTIVMLCSCLATMELMQERLGPIRFDVLADGDNALLFVSANHAKIVREQFAAVCSEVSPQELTVEEPVTLPEQVEFGQSKGVWNGTDYVMCRNVFKVLSGAFSGYRHFHDMRFGLRVLKAMADCEFYLARGLPVLQSYFGAARAALAEVPDLVDPRFWLEGHVLEAVKLAGSIEAVRAAQALTVVDAARTSFEAAFGIGIQEQLHLERVLPESVDFPVGKDFQWRRWKVWDVEGPEVVPSVDNRFYDRGSWTA